MKTLYYLSILLICVVQLGCENEEYESIYGLLVDFRVNIASFDNDLTAALSTKTFTSPRAGSPYIGFGGLLVIRSPYPRAGNTNLLDLYAYDLACPNEKRRDVKVEADNNGKAICKQCGSVFNIMESKGNVESGPAKENLVRYPVYFRANEQGTVFHIYANY